MFYRMTESEKKIIAKIRRQLSKNHKPYDFWFCYDGNGQAINWEGGFELGQKSKFRNQYTLKYRKQIIRNWKD